MASEKLFHDWHLPEGMTLVPNAKDEFDSFAKLAEEILRRDLKSYETPEDLDYLDVPKFLRRQQESAGDKPKKAVHTEAMNDITREEFNAKIETIEAKMDARVESVSAKIEGFLSAQAERDKRLDGVLAQIGKDNGETKTSIGSMKTTLIVTAVSTVLAIVLGVAGFNTALTSNMLSAFQLGKSSPTPTSETVTPEASKSSPATTSPPEVKSGS